MSDLKRCPFCGGEAKIFAYPSGGICVKCMKCFCQTEAEVDDCIHDCEKFNAYERIIKRWNARV